MLIIKTVFKSSTFFIYSLFFLTGTFHEKRKLTKIFPFYKNGQKDIVTNNRSISLLSQFWEILEKVIC